MIRKERNILPKSWATSQLSELLIALESGSRPRGGVKHIKTGFPSVGAEHLDNNGGFKFEKIKFVPKEFAAKMTRGHIQKGDILIVKDGATTGKTSLVRGSFPYPKAVINEHVFKCRCTDDVDSKYVFYFLLSSDGNQQILKDFRGAAQGGISQQFAEIVTVSIAPFNEQKRIVTEIENQFSRLDEATAALKRIKANLKRYKASVLKAAVEGKLTEEWRNRSGERPFAHAREETGADLLKRILAERRRKWEEEYIKKYVRAHGHAPRDDKWKKKYNTMPQPGSDEIEQLYKLPGKWAYVRLGELIDEPKYGTSKKCDYKINGIGVLRIPNVVNGFIDASDLKFAGFDEREIQTYRLKEGDILTIRSNGSVSLVGKCALVTKSDERYLYAGYLIKMRPFRDVVCSKYLMFCFSSLMIRKQIESKAKSTSGVNNINSGELKSLIVPISRKEEQEEIVRIVDEKLSSIDYLELAIDSNLKRAERLRQSILKKGFSGKLISQK